MSMNRGDIKKLYLNDPNLYKITFSTLNLFDDVYDNDIYVDDDIDISYHTSATSIHPLIHPPTCVTNDLETLTNPNHNTIHTVAEHNVKNTDEYILSYLSDALRHNHILTTLVIDDLSFGDCTYYINNILLYNRSIKHLCINKCIFGEIENTTEKRVDDDCDISISMSHNNSITHLFLEHINLKLEFFKKLCDGWCDNTTITTLVIENCNINDSHVNSLNNMLSKNSTLTSLSLPYNKISTIPNIVHNQNIEVLNLSYNSLNNITDICNIIKHNMVIRELHIVDNPFTPFNLFTVGCVDHVKDIEHALYLNGHITCFSYDIITYSILNITDRNYYNTWQKTTAMFQRLLDLL